MLIELLPTLTAIDIPDIQPDFNAPFMQPLQLIVSWVLAAGMILVFATLIIAVVGVSMQGLGSQRYQEWAGASILRVLAATVILGSVSGIFAFFVGFDLGF